jgi:hypothetical protein
MAEAKPFASLSSGLLARKGAAKPAMRPQGFGQMGMSLEDLGWNDMGHGAAAQANGHAYGAPEPLPEHQPSSIAALTPAPRQSAPVAAVSEAPAAAAVPASVVVAEPAPPPPVVEQQRAVEAAFAPASKPRAPAKARKTAPAVTARNMPEHKAKSAFTLRLDPQRHLKLRLACALKHRSAQQLVTEALDAFLANQPELDAFASHLPVSGNKTN